MISESEVRLFGSFNKDISVFRRATSGVYVELENATGDLEDKAFSVLAESSDSYERAMNLWGTGFINAKLAFSDAGSGPIRSSRMFLRHILLGLINNRKYLDKSNLTDWKKFVGQYVDLMSALTGNKYFSHGAPDIADLLVPDEAEYTSVHEKVLVYRMYVDSFLNFTDLPLSAFDCNWRLGFLGNIEKLNAAGQMYSSYCIGNLDHDSCLNLDSYELSKFCMNAKIYDLLALLEVLKPAMLSTPTVHSTFQIDWFEKLDESLKQFSQSVRRFVLYVEDKKLVCVGDDKVIGLRKQVVQILEAIALDGSITARSAHNKKIISSEEGFSVSLTRCREDLGDLAEVLLQLSTEKKGTYIFAPVVEVAIHPQKIGEPTN